MEKDIQKVVEILKSGGVIAFPTDTVYGIGCNIFNISGIKRIFELKKREKTKPLAAHVGSFEQIELVAYTNNKYFEILAEKFLPGPVAIILPKRNIVDDVVTCGLPNISIRFPDCPEAIQIANELDAPIAATSANISGMPSAIHHQDVYKYFPSELDFVLEAGTTKFKIESTIIDLTADSPRILRVGAVPIEEIESALNLKLK